MNEPTDVWSLILLLLALFGGIAVFRAVRLVPRSCALIVERRGRVHAEYRAGLHLLMPFIDRERSMVDLREQEMVMSPRQVTTSDGLVVSTDLTVYFQVIDPVRTTYQAIRSPTIWRPVSSWSSPRCVTSSGPWTWSRSWPAVSRSASGCAMC